MNMLADLDPATHALIWSNAVIIVGMIIKAFTDYYGRVNDRRDRELQHKLTLAEGEKRKLEIVRDVNAVGRKAEDALRTANGHNEKIASAVGAMADATKAMNDTTPRPVVVVNPPDNPVVTKSTLNPEGADE